MKFYVYIADAKVDAALAELAAEDREALARALEIDVRWLELAEAPRGAADEVRFGRVSAVARALEEAGQCGPLSAGAPYIVEPLPLHWGRLRHVRGAELLVHETESPLSFLYTDEERTLIMTGSASQLLAQAPRGTVDHANDGDDPSRSWFAIAHATSDYDALDRRSFEHIFGDAPPPGEDTAVRSWSAATSSEPWMQQLARARSDLSALPVQRLEIFAKRLATCSSGRAVAEDARVVPDRPVVLATPLFAAMVV